MNFNYSSICSSLLKDLPQRQKEVVLLRFALGERRERATLAAIGKSYGITRERVRQIERDALSKVRAKTQKDRKVFQYLKDYLKKEGGIKREDALLEELGGKNYQNQVYFLLTLSGEFERAGATENFYALWAVNRNFLNQAEKAIASLSARLQKVGKPLSFKELGELNDTFRAALEASKKIQKNQDNFFGLREWPEINPRGVKDKAYLVFQKEQKPLHFRQVAQLIGPALPQTVHNELIKDPRFVLVGRGLYALREWGHEDGAVKDVIQKILQEAGSPLSKEEVLERVLKQRLVKENTVLLNLSSRKLFLRTAEGLYTIHTKTA